MRRILLIATSLVGFAAVAIAAEPPSDQPNKPIEPPASGSSSSSLSHSRGVISPPGNVDPQMKQTPPSAGDRMPVIPPPGSPGGDQSVKPK
jgi:hypothetical protein